MSFCELVQHSANRQSGAGGIRTLGTLSRTQHFQCCTIGHSVTAPAFTIQTAFHCLGFIVCCRCLIGHQETDYSLSPPTHTIPL